MLARNLDDKETLEMMMGLREEPESAQQFAARFASVLHEWVVAEQKQYGDSFQRCHDTGDARKKLLAISKELLGL